MEATRNLLETLAVMIGRHGPSRGSERLLRAIYPCRPSTKRFVRGLRTRNDGLRMELDSRSWVDWNLLFRGDYEPHLSRLWSRIVPAGGVAIDVGANIGAHTLSLAQAVGPEGRVLAFEPNAIVRAALQKNLALNAIEHVTVFDCALGSRPGTLPLRIPKASSEASANMGLASFVALDTPHDLVEVRIQALDDVLTEIGIEKLDAIKIDVQGYEMEALLGMRESLARYRPAVVFEYDAWAWQQAKVAPDTAFHFLRSSGYELFRMDDRSSAAPQILENGAALPAYLDLLAIHRSSGKDVTRPAA